ncbi:FeoB-associated Cys-rich membrane protein [Psychroflexus tropicus]|nr:FeoB-associated Cys-rich membrane protein [Psychroflexus tropicus]
MLVLLIFLAAVGFLIKKFFLKSDGSSSGCGSGQCGCNE